MQSKGPFIYAKAANGMTVRIPMDEYQSWEKAQDEIRAGKRTADPQMVKQLTSLMSLQKEDVHGNDG